MFKLASQVDRQVQVKFRGKLFPKTETRYTYIGDDGSKLTFESHPTKAWEWNLFPNESNNLGLAQSKQIIDFHISNF